MYTSHVFYSELTWNGEKVKAGESYLRGYSGCCWYIISKEHIYAAIIGDDGIYYYTNDKNYADRIPNQWLNGQAGATRYFTTIKNCKIGNEL